MDCFKLLFRNVLRAIRKGDLPEKATASGAGFSGSNTPAAGVGCQSNDGSTVKLDNLLF
jgi:hypothetical protein